MNMDTTAIITAAIGPTLGLIGVLLRSFLGDRSYRKIKKLAELHETLPESSQGPSGSLLSDLIEAYAAKTRKKLHRQIDGASIAALVFVGIVGFLGTYFSVIWGNSVGGVGGLFIYALAFLVGLTFFLLMLVGVSQIFIYPGDKRYKTEVSSAESLS